MGADSVEAAEHDDLLDRIERERHTLPARISQLRNIKQLREQQRKNAAARRRAAARRPVQQPQGDPNLDITKRVADMLPKG